MPWSKKQKGILAAYRRYAGWSDDYYHEQLHAQTGYASSTDHRLTQEDYDAFMPIVEGAAELKHVNGAGVGRPPKANMNWHYWRDRRPPDGQVTTRQTRMIWALLQTLGDLKGHPARPMEYLQGVLTHAHGGDWPASGNLPDLLSWQAALIIEALKDRVAHAERRKEVQAS